ncbi:helix-turn-helix domain-containing protein [Paraflavitalea pollutisoli]|uniref:helix-turn-helix domain-containing protein n=1 Tax=Paraflavitalea pollutisoli TaxID=3034143 RepID=UPI0023EBA231|nr:AraC family transcriptional regulator [Paraflavitalea sp. H1-2-19X]
MKRTLSDNDLLRVQDAAAIIEANLQQHLKIPELGEKVYLNSFKLKTGFKQVYGVGPYTYLQHMRMEFAKQMLREGATLRHIAVSIGFRGAQAESNFIKAFKKYEKIPPGLWRQVHVQQKAVSLYPVYKVDISNN